MPPQRLQPLKDNLKAQARINWGTMASLTSGGFDALPPFHACQPVVACQAGQVTQDNPALLLTWQSAVLARVDFKISSLSLRLAA